MYICVLQGTVGVLEARQKALEQYEDEEPPYVLASHNYQQWLKLIHDRIVPIKHLYRYTITLFTFLAYGDGKIRQNNVVNRVN